MTTENTPSPRHLILAPAPEQLRLGRYRIPGDTAPIPRLLTTISGALTAEEYTAVFGPASKIRDHMCVHATSADGHPIRIFLSHVTAADNPDNSFQAALINGLLTITGKPTLSDVQLNTRAKPAHELTLPTAQFLLDIASMWGEPDHLDISEAAALMRGRGLELHDFLNQPETHTDQHERS